jgi:hypothetical protein
MKNNKYSYSKVIQQHYGYYGWEDVSEYDTNASFNFRTKEERLTFNHDYLEYAFMGYPTQVIKRRTLTTKF